MGRKRTRPGRTRSLSEEQIQEVLQNFDMECMLSLLILGEKQMARIERSAYRTLEAARAQMEARIHKIPPTVRHILLQEYYDMHASTAAAERGRHIPPLAMASMPDMSYTTASLATS